jgi:transcriptional regulator with XRE-family HTH domain
MIQDRRETIRLSVEDSARLAGMEVSEWAAIEAGHIPADPARLRSIAAALEVRWEDMATLVFICQGAWAE